MSEDHLSEIDSILAQELPDIEGDSDITINEREREDMVELLQCAANKLGKSPTFREYNSLNLEVSADIIKNTFGSWNDAKKAAGLETWQRGTIRNINETYFQTIDCSEKAYWFGAVFATSSLVSNGENYCLRLNRVEDRAYFITEFAYAIESDYSIRWWENEHSGKEQVELQIPNSKFIKHLLEEGYPEPENKLDGFPDIEDIHLAPFLRGFLESSGYFTTDGWRIAVANIHRGETLQKWFKQYGVKRPTVSSGSDGSLVVRVTNPFDIKALFESLWPDVLETTPSWKPYPEKVLTYLESEYPYPENLTYLDN